MKPKKKVKKKSKLRKKKDNPRSIYWRDRADRMWSSLILAKGRCEKCGRTTGRLDPHHLISRYHKMTRHRLENGICLCPHCHRFDKGSAHADPTVFSQWLSHEFPDRYQWVAENKWLLGRPDFQAAYEFLKEISGRMA